MVYKKKSERETLNCQTCGAILKDSEGYICDKCLGELHNED